MCFQSQTESFLLKSNFSADIIRDNGQGNAAIAWGRDASKEEGGRFLPGSLSNMTAGEENQEGKLSAAVEDTRQQFIRKQLSHLQHIKDVTLKKKKKKLYFPAKSELITVLTGKTSLNSPR